MDWGGVINSALATAYMCPTCCHGNKALFESEFEFVSSCQLELHSVPFCWCHIMKPDISDSEVYHMGNVAIVSVASELLFGNMVAYLADIFIHSDLQKHI